MALGFRTADESQTMSAIYFFASRPGYLAGPQFNYRIGDGVNTNDIPFQETFPYVAWSQSGRQRRHIDPGEAGCTQGAGAACPTN